MASRRCERRKKCEGKARYDTIAEAKSAAWRRRCATNDHIGEYPCQFCGGWHIGHRSARKLF